jgi:ferredoxin
VRVTVDPNRCVCSSGCADLVPSVFAVDRYELRVVDPDPPEDLRAALEEAAELCPTGAIEVGPSDGQPAAREVIT